MSKYDPDSPAAVMGNSFRDHGIETLNGLGLNFVVPISGNPDEESSPYDSRYDAAFGDADEVNLDVQLEFKTSGPAHKDSVCITPWARDRFFGERKLYVTSWTRKHPDGTMTFEDVRAFMSNDVKARLLETVGDKRWGVKFMAGKRFQPFCTFGVRLYAVGWEELAERLKKDFDKLRLVETAETTH